MYTFFLTEIRIDLYLEQVIVFSGLEFVFHRIWRIIYYNNQEKFEEFFHIIYKKLW